MLPKLYRDNPTLKEIDYVKKQELVFKNIQKPFIQGIINNNENLFKKRIYEFENWNRSHESHKLKI